MYALTLPIYPLDKKFEIQYFFGFLRPIIIVSKPGPLEQECTCSFKSLLINSCCLCHSGSDDRATQSPPEDDPRR